MIYLTDYSDLEYYMHDYNIQRYKPTDDILEKYKDGGLAIIDQWISAHARCVIWGQFWSKYLGYNIKTKYFNHFTYKTRCFYPTWAPQIFVRLLK